MFTTAIVATTAQTIGTHKHEPYETDPLHEPQKSRPRPAMPIRRPKHYWCKCVLKVGTCESAVYVLIESRIESGVTIRIESRIESAVYTDQH